MGADESTLCGGLMRENRNRHLIEAKKQTLKRRKVKLIRDDSERLDEITEALNQQYIEDMARKVSLNRMKANSILVGSEISYECPVYGHSKGVVLSKTENAVIVRRANSWLKDVVPLDVVL